MGWGNFFKIIGILFVNVFGMLFIASNVGNDSDMIIFSMASYVLCAVIVYGHKIVTRQQKILDKLEEMRGKYDF